MCRNWSFFVTLVTFTPNVVLAQSITDCPPGWIPFEDRCYDFVFYPAVTYQTAISACQYNGAYLVSVNTQMEHEFISNWLTRHDMDRSHRWWTSGIGEVDSFRWEGDGTVLTFNVNDKWGEQGMALIGNQHVVYKFTTMTNTFLWSRQHVSESSPYICEISRQEAFRVHQAERDFAYGTNFTEPELAPRGPRFTIIPQTIIIVVRAAMAFLECAVQSLPLSTYTWYKKVNNGFQAITTSMDSRYSLTNGRFSFQSPVEIKDAGEYYCMAENPFGSIMSETVRVNFGYLGEFSNDRRGAVRANLYQGTYIDCNTPPYNPAVYFQWYKGPGVNFVRTEMNPHTFVSNNGRLYFSETQTSDAGLYYCVVTLTATQRQTLATVQPPSRTSLAIELIIRGDMATDFGPYIHNDFPTLFPSPPLRGSDLRLECFAYGRLPLYYTWSRDNGPIPAKVQYQDHGRVLLIPAAELEDSGNYTCRVQQSSNAMDTKTLALRLEAVPYFTFPLRDLHADAGREIIMRCVAMGVPLPRYAWYKNGQPLHSVPGDIEVKVNTVVIKSANKTRHSGMYQCSASNVYGTRLSSAQLRVLAFAPNFSKRPLDPSQMATTGGNATITCQPEASPRPEVSWSHNGIHLEIGREISGRIILLGNGNLLITQVQISDQGEYRCTATNSEGSASSSGLLLVVEQATITVHPDDTFVVVNNTAFMSCEASYNRLHHELVYIWHLNDHIIDINNDPHFKLASRDGVQGIYIINAQFQHEGRYECRAVTVKDSARASAYLTVQGPPSEPAGVFGQVIDRSIHLSWTDGTSHASAINSYIIELKSNFNPRWRLALSDLDNAEMVDVQYPSRRKQVISDLSPGSSYSFRVRAVNSYGIGPASVQSPFYKVPDAPPTRAPDGIVNIFSSVGMLAFTWNVLNPEYLTGQNIGYQVYWRKKEEGKDRHWETDRVLGQDNSYKALVGSDNYFLEYEVMVAAFNSLGHGPNSSITIIMSAEDLPIATPRNVWGEDHNSSALNVYWDPVENTREMIRGKIIGYQITWWWESEPLLTYWSRHHCDDCGHAVVLVPHPKDNYWVYVQVFNSAGFGPKGEIAFATTFLSPPQLYPEYVSINSHSNNSVYVSWRGVPIGGLEEALNGYKLWWWPATENMNTAHITLVNKRLQTWAILEGIKKDIVYAVRVMGFSRGGDGKKSPTVYFTLGGQVVYNSITTDILAAGICTTASFGMLLSFALTHVLVYLMYC